MAELIRQGKVRYFGVSNYRAWRVAEICNICDRLGIDRPVASQPYYNAMNRMPEVEHFPACGYYGLGIVPYSPLARGVLTAKYRVDAAPDKDTRAGRNDTRMMQTEWRPESIKLAQEIKRPRGEQRHHRRPVRGRLGAEFVLCLFGDRRPPHRGAMGRLHPRARLQIFRRRRGTDRSPGHRRPSLDARLQRSRLSDRGATRADEVSDHRINPG
jgi:Aldo/keto reductase family